MPQRQDLLGSPLFHNVPETAIRMAEEAVVERSFACGEVLVSQEAQGEALFLITQGRARVVRVSLGGRERVLGFMYAPAVFGEIAVLSTSERSASVVADTEVHALMLHRNEFEQLLTRFPKVLLNLAKILADRVASLNDELIALGISTEASMAHLFVNLYRQRAAAGEANARELPLLQNDLMLRLSASRETVSRVLKKLERDKLVRNANGHIQVLDLERLERLGYGLDED
ncbi:Crp/Fnr family transcriptional regulator [Deinococcus peraridilitoris]|nr:Crp/Fnr family transcriptional regulator [Deinococcus peraridilitoris]